MFAQLLAQKTALAVNELYGHFIESEQVSINKTKKDYNGDYTVVVFPFTKISKKSPELTAHEIGQWLQNALPQVESFNVIKGYLNIILKDEFWIDFLFKNYQNLNFGLKSLKEGQPPILIEFSSPNTNKPLHLGHIRNNLLGHSLSEILKATGLSVVKVNLVNDRGIHICKSMLAWKKWGNGETPESIGIKGDHLVGKYYVLFEKKYQEEVSQLKANGLDEETALRSASLILEAQEMLRKWEAGDAETLSLWEMMNSWVYEGFNETYKRLGISFDKIYYESDTYSIGKKIVEEGLKAGIFYQKEDGSIWVDLTSDNLDQKLLLRSDGTSVYITQDLGCAELRYQEFSPQKMIYVVGNEQNYHFEVLQHILQRLGKAYADKIFHLSYGMVDLPEGKMKSREGTVVDADDLIDEMVSTAREITLELGKTSDLGENEAQKLFSMIGLAALKYFILKVDPKKNILFNPAESIDFDGNTGPFIQYTHARIRSVLRKANQWSFSPTEKINLLKEEKEILKLLYEFPFVIEQSAKGLDPSQIANFAYELARTYNQFYHNLSILHEPDEQRMITRLALSQFTAQVIRISLHLLGIEVPEQM